MLDFSAPNLSIALLVTTAAGLATALGSLLVLTSRCPGPRLLAFGLAFAGGAMVYVSLSEILNKSVAAFTAIHGDKLGFSYGTLAFLAGVVLIALIDRLIPNPHQSLDTEANPGTATNARELRRIGLLTAVAITAHNLPEGLATFFAMLENPGVGLPLAVAIAIHNIPEGISIALPVYFATGSRRLAFFATLIAGLAEPVGAIAGWLLLAPFASQAAFGAVFGIVAGIMVYLAIDELLPAAKRHAQGHETVYGLVTGMAALALSLVLFKW